MSYLTQNVEDLEARVDTLEIQIRMLTEIVDELINGDVEDVDDE